jgi:hypothetical protein
MKNKKGKDDYIWDKYDNMPTSYKEYQRKLKVGIKRINDDVKRRLSRFPYRYRLAKSFVGIDAKEVGRTLIGYEAGMKVFLAYTAYEDIIAAAQKMGVGVKSKYRNEIINEKLAKELIRNIKLIEFVRENITDEDEVIRQQVEKFIRGETYDVLFLALAIRNFYAHGVFTATQGGVTNLDKKRVYFKLADTLLNYCDARFTNCVNLLEEKNG